MYETRLSTRQPLAITHVTLLMSTSSGPGATIFIPDHVIEGSPHLREIERIISANSDKDIGNFFDYIWLGVLKLLQGCPDVKRPVTTRETYNQNIQRLGEKSFRTFLRDVAKKKDWRRLLTNGTPLNSIVSMTNLSINSCVQTYFLIHLRKHQNKTP